MLKEKYSGRKERERGESNEQDDKYKDGILVTFPTPKHKAKAIRNRTHFEEADAIKVKAGKPFVGRKSFT